jgi:hypothetical protein
MWKPILVAGNPNAIRWMLSLTGTIKVLQRSRVADPLAAQQG